jgi:signal transduction histidine kinase
VATESILRAGDPGAEAPSLGLTPLSRVRLDQLVQELVDRVGDVVASRERLLDAVVAISTDLDLHRTLERIIAAACQLAGARYGALGVIGDDRRLTEFITYGLGASEREVIGDLPTGRGVLGLLIEDPRPLRLNDVAQHEDYYGFPPGHPPMHSFLGVPIRVRDKIFGNLYLTEKVGSEHFSDEDEQIVVALAAAAGAAIDNARLYSLAQRRHRWLAAAAEITDVLLGRVHRTAALALVARRAREVADAELAMVLLHDEERGLLTVEVVEMGDGDVGAGLVGATLPLEETHFAEAVTTKHHVVVEHLGKAAPWPAPLTARVATVVPLVTADALHGLLVVAHRQNEGRDLDEDLAMLTAFGGQAALALERAHAQEEREMFVILEDRERIARDLHDVVIQRLFATGLQLQTAATLAGRPEVTARVNTAVDELDTTIRDIRSAIFELRTPMSATLREEVREIVEAASAALRFRPTLEIAGPVDSAASAEIRADLLAVLREALSNVVRHAKASAVAVTVRAQAGRLVVVVKDDGVGVGSTPGRGGLLNMSQRAAHHNGFFEVRALDPHGTLIEWNVPV